MMQISTDPHGFFICCALNSHNMHVIVVAHEPAWECDARKRQQAK